MNHTHRFLSTLFGPYTSRAHIELRCFRPKWNPITDEERRHGIKEPREWFPCTEEGIALASETAQRVSVLHDTYMGVLPRMAFGGSSCHLRLAAWIWADIDAGNDTFADVRTLLQTCVKERGLPIPQIVVRSGGGLHCYWRIEAQGIRTNQEQHRLREVMRRLGLLMNGRIISPKDEVATSVAHACPAATDCARILRVPGTCNLKIQDDPRPVALLRCEPESGEVHSLLWWEGELPPIPLPPKPEPRAPFRPRSGSWDGPSLPPGTIDKIASGASDGLKHFTMLQVGVAARKQGFDEAEIRNFVEQCGIASGVPVDDYQQRRHTEGIVDWVTNTVQPDYSQF